MYTNVILCLFVSSIIAISEGAFNSLHLKHHNYGSTNNYSYQTEYFEQHVDHFGFVNTDTFKQRYLIATQYWNKNAGPIFFYTGNEGDIAWFCNNTGFLWDIAGEFKAMLVFAEHRFYGESLPYGSETYKHQQHLNYLTSEQALADFAVLIESLKQTIPGAADSRVVAVGGSYGGMLAAWFRMKYPNIVVGALAASAPIWLFTGITPCEAYSIVLTKAYTATGSEQCVKNIRNSWKTIDEIAKTGEGKNFITYAFKLCNILYHQADVDNFKTWLASAWTNLGLMNYPYPANFLEPLPAWPVKAVCNKMSTPVTGKQLLVDIAAAMNIYFNYTGSAFCLNTTQQATSNLGDLGWDYQSCTEMVMPLCSNGVDDMFEPSPWNFTTFSEQCNNRWKTRPRQNWITTQYWGIHLQNASNIIFSNGLLDPCSSGGVLTSTSLTVIPIIIRDGAHHLDLRAANPLDTADVIAARTQEKNILKEWLGQD